MRKWAVVAALLAACGSSGSSTGHDAGGTWSDGGSCNPAVDCRDDGNSHSPNLPDGGYAYASQPPCSGNHYPVPASWGIHADPVPREEYVHNEEHGGVVLLYNCPSGCPDVVSAFTQLYQERQPDAFGEVKLVVTPDPLYDGGFAAAAWDHVYRPTTLSVDAFRCFIDAYIDNGPENAP